MKGLRARLAVPSQNRSGGKYHELSLRGEPAERVNHDASTMSALDLHRLEARVDELISALNDISTENRALRNQHAGLLAERAALIEKSELARSRVESMIARLKAMEVSS